MDDFFVVVVAPARVDRRPRLPEPPAARAAPAPVAAVAVPLAPAAPRVWRKAAYLPGMMDRGARQARKARGKRMPSAEKLEPEAMGYISYSMELLMLS